MWQRLTKIILLEIAILTLLSGFYGELNDKQQTGQCIERICKVPLGVLSRRKNNAIPSKQGWWNIDSGKDGEVVSESKEVTAYIREVFGEDAGFGLALGRCESGFNPFAYNPAGPYYGVFQYDIPTWDANCVGDISDHKAQTDCTKKLLDKGEEWRWPSCSQKIK